MNKYVLKVLGMRCGMCELHVEEAICVVKGIRLAFNRETASKILVA